MGSDAAFRVQEDTVLVVLGASGDLAKKKLVYPQSIAYRIFTSLLILPSSSQHYSVS